MAFTPKEKEWLLYGGMGAGGLLLFFLFARPSAHPSGKGATPQKTVTANPAQASLDQSIVQARDTALQAFDAGSLGVSTNETNKQIAFNTNAAQTAQTRIQSAAEQAIASTQASAEEQMAAQEAQAQEQAASASETQGIFGSIFGGLASIFPFLDFNRPNTMQYGNPFAFWNYLFPSSSGSPTQNPSTGLPWDFEAP